MRTGVSSSAPVVSNTTPLISLGEIGLLDVLHPLYDEIWIPPAVVSEYRAGMAAHPQRPDLTGFSWISVHPAPADPLVPDTLDPGEAEAIALARSCSARLVLIDEQRGRATAQAMGRPMTGTLGVLLDAKAHGLIAPIRPYIDQMLAQGRRISPRLRQDVLLLAGE